MATLPTHPAAAGALRRQTLRFLLTGVLNTAVGYALYLVGLLAGLMPEIALAVATMLGAVFNYFSTGRIVFRYSAMDRLPRFVGAYALLYLFNAALLRGLIGVFAHPALIQAMLLPLMAAASFVVFRFFVFPGKDAA